jgi:glutamyl-tRNA synthetase
MIVVTRFAPAPTGLLHIGSARTALFNYLFAKNQAGKFLLRIEDTDKVRSTQEAKNQLLTSLSWLEINWDDEVVIQSERDKRHQEVAEELIRLGKAYYCYMTEEEKEAQRTLDPFAKIVSPWRNSQEAKRDDIPWVVKMKMPQEGIMTFSDLVQGEVSINLEELNDFVLLRADGSPTYLLAAVVDDHDMGVTHVIRGDDHLTNAFKQIIIYEALGWPVPIHAHIPLIHAIDGSKLSKRHGATGVEQYKAMGYLPEGLCNYLLRLGWGGDGQTEILPREEAIKLFDMKNLSKSPAKFDKAKLDFFNHHYLQTYPDQKLLQLILEIWPDGEKYQEKILQGLPLFKLRSNSILDLIELAKLIVEPSAFDEKSQKLVVENKAMLEKLALALEALPYKDFPEIKSYFQSFAEREGVKESLIMQLLRASILRTFASPGIYEMIALLGKEESVARILSC